MSIKSRGIILPRKHKKCDHPKVSVIVPVYKVDRYLTQCLNSIVNQTMEDLEIIIVDEGDMDRCREIIDVFEKNDPRIMAPHKKNGGYGASVNLGMSMARGEYIAIVESDDWIEQEMYEEMYAYAKSLDADVVKTPYYSYFCDGHRQDCEYRHFIKESVPQNICFSIKEYGELMQVHASLWSAIYRTSYMRKYDIRFIEAKGGAYVDVGFRIDTLIHTNRIAWLDKPYYNYRIDSVGSTTNNFNMKGMLQRWDEVHQSIDKMDYEKYYGRYLIIDEFLNTIGQARHHGIDKELYKKLKVNIFSIPESVIDETKALNENQKKEIRQLQNTPNFYYIKINFVSVLYRLYLRFHQEAEREMLRFSSPVLLFWMFIGFFVTMMLSISMSITQSPLQQYWSSENFAMISICFLSGIAFCFFMKALRKGYLKIRSFFSV